MARIVADDIKATMKVDVLKESGDLDPFIATANALVNESLASEGYSEELLTEIEKYLACHFVAIRERRVASNEGTSFEGKTGVGFDYTPYGQMAVSLEFHGVLGRIGKGAGKVQLKTLP